MSNHDTYILAAYGVTLVLLAAEVWTLVRRSRAQARERSRRLHNGGMR
jgi:heme exporter protein CcmD